MFIHCKRSLEIREGEQVLSLPTGFVGEIPTWAETHWYLKAALTDGTVTASEGRRDMEREKSERKRTET